MRFSELAIGDVFRFAYEDVYRTSGIARGPWRKISPRRYVRAGTDDDTRYAHIVFRVGTVHAEVIRIPRLEQS